MNKWETTRYLIDAKKCVDSIVYISENEKQLHYIDLRKKVADKKMISISVAALCWIITLKIPD